MALDSPGEFVKRLTKREETSEAMLTQARPESDVSIAILYAGERAFAEFGYDGASMRAIARDAGVNQAMISY